MRRVHVWTSKEEIDASLLENATAVVMDVLLATTTLITILENGARRVFPVADLAEVWWVRDFLDSGSVTGGEELGYPIPGFDCGPLPGEFSSEIVADRDVVLLTTNGTRAIRRAETASQLLIANLRNALAVARYLERYAADDVYLICAGSRGHVSLEDTLCAGIILSHMDLSHVDLNDAAQIARHGLAGGSQDVFEWISMGRVGRWFMQTGQESLLRFVADVGASDTLAEVINRQLQILAPVKEEL